MCRQHICCQVEIIKEKQVTKRHCKAAILHLSFSALEEAFQRLQTAPDSSACVAALQKSMQCSMHTLSRSGAVQLPPASPAAAAAVSSAASSGPATAPGWTMSSVRPSSSGSTTFCAARKAFVYLQRQGSTTIATLQPASGTANAQLCKQLSCLPGDTVLVPRPDCCHGCRCGGEQAVSGI